MKPRRFGIALRNLLLDREEDLTPSGNVNLLAFSEKLPNYHYETLRKAVTGERALTTALIEEVAAVLGVPLGYFYEYGLLRAQEAFDATVVGLEEALRNLEVWEASREDRVSQSGGETVGV